MTRIFQNLIFTFKEHYEPQAGSIPRNILEKLLNVLREYSKCI